ncbi:MAG: DUF1461 domain-containing protein [Clostridia bacterium]|nr:DUF1461 domain-containing protein [Clostridia bacterium]
MKNRSILMGVEAALLMMALLFSAGLNAVRTEAVSPDLYNRWSRAAVAEMHGGDPQQDAAMIDAYIGLNAADQQRFSEEIAAYMRGRSDHLPDELNEKEQIHFGDVRRLVRLAERVSRILLGLCVLLAIALAWMSQYPGIRLRAMGAGALAGLLLTGLAAAFILTHFDAAFYKMHEMLFTNDLWLMDPRTDIIIRVMPAELFMHAAVRCLGRAAVQSIVILVMLAVLYFFMRRLISKWAK